MRSVGRVEVRRGERFSRTEHVRQSRQFRRIQRSGQRRAGRFVLVIACRGEQPWTRIGLTVSRKVGNAVKRNRVKRCLREVFRRNKAAFASGLDLVLIARPQAAGASYQQLQQELLSLAATIRTPPARERSRTPRPRTGRQGD